MTSRTVAEYQRHVRGLLAPLVPRGTATIALAAALGRTTAEDLYAPVDLPVFRNSAMDGYAVRAASVAAAPVTLPMAGTIAAGDPGLRPLPPGAAMKIMTGAPLPPGADCVVPVEDTAADLDAARVTVRAARAAGEYVREPGSDVTRGALLLPSGTVLAPRHVAALAAVGIAEVAVRTPVRVAVITTGDELRPAGEQLGPGQIYNSNGIALATLLTANAAEPVLVTHSGDEPGEFRRVLDAAVACADLVLTSGGVSMGDFEVVKDTLTPLGGVFGHVAVQPGGPQGATVVAGVPVLSFPGNPVSTMVSFEVFLRPVLRAAAGLPATLPETLPVTVALRSPAGKRQYLRGRRTADGVAPIAGHGSHLIVAMASADVLIEVPEPVTELPAGASTQVWAL